VDGGRAVPAGCRPERAAPFSPQKATKLLSPLLDACARTIPWCPARALFTIYHSQVATMNEFLVTKVSGRRPGG